MLEMKLKVVPGSVGMELKSARRLGECNFYFCTILQSTVQLTIKMYK